MNRLRVLCLFSSAALRDASLFVHREVWATDIDQGRCEFVPLLVDEDVCTLATSGLFAAATIVCRHLDLTPASITLLRAAGASFARVAVPLELVPVDGPVGVLERLGEHEPELAALCRIDGEVKLDSPTWWRDRARRHMRVASARGGDASEQVDLERELREFIARRGW